MHAYDHVGQLQKNCILVLPLLTYNPFGLLMDITLETKPVFPHRQKTIDTYVILWTKQPNSPSIL